MEGTTPDSLQQPSKASDNSLKMSTLTVLLPSMHVFYLSAALLACFVGRYLLHRIAFHKTHQISQTKRVPPPTYPSAIPIIGNSLGFAFDGVNFVKNATTYSGHPAAARVSLLSSGVYLFQDANSVADLWKSSSLSSPIWVYLYGLRHFFGMPRRAEQAYLEDDSGPFPRPHKDSKVAPHNRIDYLTHHGLLRGLTGPGLVPTFRRLIDGFEKSMDSTVSSDWVEFSDLLSFFKENLGRAAVKSLFGPSFLGISPTMMEDLWTFDDDATLFSKGLPKFLMPRACKNRTRLLQNFKIWYGYAREHFDESKIYEDGDGDPFWGSALLRERQSILPKIIGQDDDSIASADLGLAWSVVTNMIPSSMMAIYHIFVDPALCERVRHSLRDMDPETLLSDNNIDKILRNPLLLSVYAETLRCYVQTYTTRTSPRDDVALGRWILPKNEIAMVNSHIAHMNTDIWNTKDGQHPVESFWAERFLVDPNDPTSGPIKKSKEKVKISSRSDNTGDKATFSLHGLEGAWIPYGGGYTSCPGRLLAKRIIITTCAIMALRCDVDIKTKDIEMDSSGFGLGTQRPKQNIVFRIRRRTDT